MRRPSSLQFAAPLLAGSLLLGAAQADAQEGAPLPSLPPNQPAQSQPPTIIIQQQYPAPVYQPPPYPQGQPYYVQQAAPPPVTTPGPRVLRDWDDSEPIPPGYHIEERKRVGLIVGGAVMFGTTYLLSALVASVDSDVNKGSSNPAAALWVPGIGPFIQMTQTGSATADFFLVIDGLAQAGGLAMFTIGLVAPRAVAVRNNGGLSLHLTPIVARDHTGMGLVGTF